MTPDAATCGVCEIHAESVFRVDGMDCHEEVALLERRLGRLAGVEHLTADLVGRRLTVAHDAARVSTSAIADAVGQTGMQAWLEHEAPTGLAASARRRRLLVAVAGVGVAGGMAMQASGLPAVLVVPVFLASMLAGGTHLVRRAWGSVRARTIDINVLMLIAVAGAVVLEEWAEAAMVVFLFGLAQWLESGSLDRVRGAIRSLMDLSPAETLVRRGGVDERVAVDDVALGDRIVIRPGQKIPLDGRVLAGTSFVNQAAITGESLAVEKAVGDDVFAGTINGRGVLEVDVTRRRPDTTLARIIALVERAQAQRAPSQTFVDTFARYYTPAVVAGALVIGGVVPSVLGQPFEPWIYRALVLLVISCPCALVISTPVAIVSALAAAARQGVLVKGGVHLERLATATCMAFDKTGTLTTGHPCVLEIRPLDGWAPAEVLETAAAVEARSEHPIARAIVQAAADRRLPVRPAASGQALPGRGAEGVIDGQPVLVGNRRLFQERQLVTPEVDALVADLAARGRTAVLVSRGGRTAGAIGVADEVRDAAVDAIAMLRRQGIEHLALLTGDHESAARGVARDLGLDEFRSDLLPEDKVRAVEDLRSRHRTVVMIGDGINDAPALATAHVGVVMGAVGSDAALETADVALMADELIKLPFVMRLSRATLRAIQVNITLSLVLKAVFLVLAILGSATLWMAVVADLGASLVVIANGLRLLRVR